MLKIIDLIDVRGKTIRFPEGFSFSETNEVCLSPFDKAIVVLKLH